MSKAGKIAIVIVLAVAVAGVIAMKQGGPSAPATQPASPGWWTWAPPPVFPAR